jgi:hypothetical protein
LERDRHARQRSIPLLPHSAAHSAGSESGSETGFLAVSRHPHTHHNKRSAAQWRRCHRAATPLLVVGSAWGDTSCTRKRWIQQPAPEDEQVISPGGEFIGAVWLRGRWIAPPPGNIRHRPNEGDGRCPVFPSFVSKRPRLPLRTCSDLEYDRPSVAERRWPVAGRFAARVLRNARVPKKSCTPRDVGGHFLSNAGEES